MFVMIILIFGIFGVVRLFQRNAIINGIDPANDEQGNFMYCSGVLNCLGVAFYGGMLHSDISSVLTRVGPHQGYGHDDPSSPNFTVRFFYDILFFIIIACLLLNMVTGIIVDTFSKLREDSQVLDQLKADEVFVSGITYDMLEGTGLNMKQLQKKDHNEWNYIYYAIFLLNEKYKDPMEYDGLETYVADCIMNDDFSWFPRKTCAALGEMEGLSQGDKGNEEDSSKDDGARSVVVNLQKEVKNLQLELGKMSQMMNKVMETVITRTAEPLDGFGGNAALALTRSRGIDSSPFSSQSTSVLPAITDRKSTIP